MELVITNKARLIQKCGVAAWEQIRSTLDAYFEAIGSIGHDAELFLLDDITHGAAIEPKVLKAKLKELHNKTKAEYLLFLGGDDIVPFYRQPDQTPDQALDGNILSDSYYVDFNEFEHDHWPEMAVGRIPDGGDGQLLVQMLTRTVAAHLAGGIPVSDKHAGFSTDTWQSASKMIYFRIDPIGDTLKLTPPLGLREGVGINELIDVNHFPEGSLLFFNLHGHRQKPLWFGEKRIVGVPLWNPVLVDYELMNQTSLANNVILCEACHGAAISGRTPENSLALCALQRGAIAFFGSTVKSYAVTLPDGKPSGASGIDALFMTLIFNLVKMKMRFGDALCDAKQRQTFQNAYDEKNLFGLSLLGDPILCFV